MTEQTHPPTDRPTGRVHPAVERMSGFDASMLYLETPTQHMHTLKIAILEADPERTFDSFVAGLVARLDRLPTLRRELLTVPFGLHHPVWVTRHHIDPQRHVIRHRVPAEGTMRDLEVLIGRIASTPLDRRHPLWELHYCEGLEGDQVAVVGKIHHALADGQAANALLGNVTNVRSTQLPEAPADRYEATDRTPSRVMLLRHAWADAAHQALLLPGLLVRTWRGVAAAVRYSRSLPAGDAVPRPVLDAPRTSLNGPLGVARTFATSSLSLAEVKRIRAQHDGATLNDLVLATVSGALRRWLAEHDEHPSRALTASIPVGLNERGGAPRLVGNQVSSLFTTLATDVDDPVERVQVIHRTTGHAKQLLERRGRRMMLDWSQYAPPLPVTWAVRAYTALRAAAWHPSGTSVIVSNVPGPRSTAQIGTARLASLFSVGPLTDGIGLNVTVWSYVDQLNFSLLACPDLLPDVEVLAAHLPAALAELDLDAPAASGTPDLRSRA